MGGHIMHPLANGQRGAAHGIHPVPSRAERDHRPRGSHPPPGPQDRVTIGGNRKGRLILKRAI